MWGLGLVEANLDLLDSPNYELNRANTMGFFTEPPGYEKTLLSELQGAWECLREAVIHAAGFEGWDRMLFHIDEAMSWETVRHLERMEPLVVLIRNVAQQGDAPQAVTEAISEVADLLKGVYQDRLHRHPQ